MGNGARVQQLYARGQWALQLLADAPVTCKSRAPTPLSSPGGAFPAHLSAGPCPRSNPEHVRV